MGRKGTVTLVRVRGLPVRLHYTFLIILPYLAWVIGRTTPVLARLAGVDPGALVLPRYLLGAILGVSLFLCVLAHELAHIGIGILGGGKFSGVTLMIVGGVSEVIELPKRPIWEASMAIAGPLASLLIALIGFAVFGLFDLQADLAFSAFYLAYVNLALAVFNLVPAFPMDGGRILRAVLAMITTRVRATKIASYIGQGFAGLFLLGGLLDFNWVLIVIGVLVIIGARAELEMVKVGAMFEGLTVGDAMQPTVPTIDENERVAAVLERMARELRTTFFVTSGGELVGAITAVDARKVDGSGDGMARIRDVMRRKVPTLESDQDLAEASRILRTSGLSALPVLENGVPIGQLTVAGMAAAVRERDARQAELRERRAT